MKAYEAVFPARGCTVDLFSTPPLDKSNVCGLSQDLVLLHSLDVFYVHIGDKTRDSGRSNLLLIAKAASFFLNMAGCKASNLGVRTLGLGYGHKWYCVHTFGTRNVTVSYFLYFPLLDAMLKREQSGGLPRGEQKTPAHRAP